MPWYIYMLKTLYANLHFAASRCCGKRKHCLQFILILKKLISSKVFVEKRSIYNLFIFPKNKNLNVLNYIYYLYVKYLQYFKRVSKSFIYAKSSWYYSIHSILKRTHSYSFVHTNAPRLHMPQAFLCRRNTPAKSIACV